jgi:hypothetical protein
VIARLFQGLSPNSMLRLAPRQSLPLRKTPHFATKTCAVLGFGMTTFQALAKALELAVRYEPETYRLGSGGLAA